MFVYAMRIHFVVTKSMHFKSKRMNQADTFSASELFYADFCECEIDETKPISGIKMVHDIARTHIQLYIKRAISSITLHHVHFS